jgi:BP28CT (NUC211) domain
MNDFGSEDEYKLAIDGNIKLISSFALKSSESTFRKQFESIVKWSKITHDYTASTDELMERKLVMMRFVDYFDLDEPIDNHAWKIRYKLLWPPF